MTIKSLLSLNNWKCFFLHCKGIINLAKNDHLAAKKSFQAILNDSSFSFPRDLSYKNLGIACALLKEFNEATIALEESLRLIKQRGNEDAELYQWLGYVYCVNEKYDTALFFFKKAIRMGQTGIDKWLINKEYIDRNIHAVQNILLEINDDQLPNKTSNN